MSNKRKKTASPSTADDDAAAAAAATTATTATTVAGATRITTKSATNASSGEPACKRAKTSTNTDSSSSSSSSSSDHHDNANDECDDDNTNLMSVLQDTCVSLRTEVGAAFSNLSSNVLQTMQMQTMLNRVMEDFVKSSVHVESDIKLSECPQRAAARAKAQGACPLAAAAGTNKCATGVICIRNRSKFPLANVKVYLRVTSAPDLCTPPNAAATKKKKKAADCKQQNLCGFTLRSAECSSPSSSDEKKQDAAAAAAAKTTSCSSKLGKLLFSTRVLQPSANIRLVLGLDPRCFSQFNALLNVQFPAVGSPERMLTVQHQFGIYQLHQCTKPRVVAAPASTAADMAVCRADVPVCAAKLRALMQLSQCVGLSPGTSFAVDAPDKTSSCTLTVESINDKDEIRLACYYSKQSNTCPKFVRGILAETLQLCAVKKK
jgi:hypothetical protein